VVLSTDVASKRVSVGVEAQFGRDMDWLTRRVIDAISSCGRAMRQWRLDFNLDS